MFDDTIKNNISYARPSASDDEIMKACVFAAADEFIKKLPKSYDTMIGENGVRLSGGQYKRIALARTFYFGKKIIVMDEATNSLDLDSEKYIMEQVNELKNKKTIIIITHRLDILKNCNKIYKIENKKINLMEEK